MSLPDDYHERKTWQMFTYLTEYFPDSFEEEVRVAIVGNQQHNPGEPLHWARDKSTDQLNTAFRHQWDHKTKGPKDKDGCYHLAKAIWRLKAELQLVIEKERASAPPVRIGESYECCTPRCQNKLHNPTGAPLDVTIVKCEQCGASRWSKIT